jgi:hypothetical protein
MQFPYLAYQPDRGELASPLMVCDNVLPTADGVAPFPSLYVETTAAALPAAPRGVFSVVLNNGNWRAYEFTDSALYELQSDYTLSLIANGYACPVGDDWSALHFGTKLLYTNTVDGLLSYDVEAGGAASSITAAGKPRYIFTCANFVIGLDCLDSLGNRNNRLIRTSGFNDQTNWTSDGADYQELADGEALLAGFDLKENTALLLQQRALVLMQFGNAPGGAQFSLRKIADGKGTVGAKSCVSFDGMVFYLATDDFYMFSLATGNVAIGADEIARTFLASVDQSQLVLVQGALDPLNKVVIWRYKRSVDSSTTVSEVAIGYEWRLKRWFTLTEQTSYLTRLATVAVTYNSISGTYDSQVLQYDDRALSGAAPLFGALDENYKFGVFNGPALAGTVTTGIRNSAVTGLMQSATPMDDCATGTLELGVRAQLSDTTTWKTGVSKATSGRAMIRGRGKNIQFRRNFPAGATWTHAYGVDHVVGSSGGPK